jgi:Protein of unknown function (DUF3592)
MPWLLLLGGVVVVVLCGQRILHRHQLQSDGSTTSATVKWATMTGARSNQIQVSYRDAEGKSWTKDFAVFSSQYKAGQSVDVVYLPINPQIAMLGPREAGVTSAQEAVGGAVGGLAVFLSAVWLLAARLWRRP